METTDATAARVGARSSFAERLVLAAVGVEGTGHVLELSDPKALQQREFRDIRDECESNCRGQRGSHKDDWQSRHYDPAGGQRRGD
jgi:hypothetical protein